jgi:predicted lipid-binding transport protein (Tim44 family)
MTQSKTRLASVLGMTLAVSLLAVDAADARRGGSFGSRGSRTYQAPPPTRTAPQQTAPVQRSMTPQEKAAAPAAAPATAGAQAQAPGRRGFFGGIGGGILGGLVAGGLLGMMLGHGWGGMGAGLGNTLLQVLLIGGGIWLLMSLVRRRSAQPAGFPREAAFQSGAAPPFGANRAFDSDAGARTTYTPQTDAEPRPAPGPTPTHDIGLTQADRDAFERLLKEVQEAFGREDYAGLRAITTPEIMSYLAEELSENATHGRRNEVTGTKLLQADIAEAWAEGDTDYATAAMRYESTDVMRDRASGEVLGGDAAGPSETTELWTFVRQPGQPWRLSAIQDA